MKQSTPDGLQQKDDDQSAARILGAPLSRGEYLCRDIFLNCETTNNRQPIADTDNSQQPEANNYKNDPLRFRVSFKMCSLWPYWVGTWLFPFTKPLKK